jgi:RNA polymerase sigma factor (sigma-70 family)
VTVADPPTEQWAPDAVAAAEAWCCALHPRLVGAMSLYCQTLEDAEDVAQEALSRAWERWPAVSAHPDPEGWVFRTAFNLANSRWRRLRVERRPHRLAPATVSEVDAPDFEVRRAVAGLPPRQREAIVRRFFLDESVADASAAMGCAPGTVKALTHQAIEQLRRGGLDAEEVGGDD